MGVVFAENPSAEELQLYNLSGTVIYLKNFILIYFKYFILGIETIFQTTSSSCANPTKRKPWRCIAETKFSLTNSRRQCKSNLIFFKLIINF